ncbi:MAG: hypothetical protein EBR15_09475 [Gammaproteobacteria bacterium]|nr:hypothetical protein [Gammaproteobacteria bacterium]
MSSRLPTRTVTGRVDCRMQTRARRLVHRYVEARGERRTDRRHAGATESDRRRSVMPHRKPAGIDETLEHLGVVTRHALHHVIFAAESGELLFGRKMPHARHRAHPATVRADD